MKLIPYKMASASAKALADALGVRRLRLEGPPKALGDEIVINWGCSTIPRAIITTRLLNPPERIQVSVDKLRAFQALKETEVAIPEFTTERTVAESWIQEGKKVVCRTKLRSYGGDGIVIASSVDELVAAPLYVRYYPKEQEYRVHVMNGQVFFTQRKARKLDVPDEQVNWQVRNLAGGFIYANQAVEAPAPVAEVAIGTCRGLSLDFGAVDILVTPRGKVLALEVNTACGLAGTTLEKYVEAFRNLSQST